MENEGDLAAADGFHGSLFEKIEEPIKQYMLCQLKIRQLLRTANERRHINASHIQMIETIREMENAEFEYILTHIRKFDNQ